MFRKNTAGQNLGFKLVSATTGLAVAGATVTAWRNVDNAGQAAATGTVSSAGNGQYNLALSQADTDGDDISFLFLATGCVPEEKTLVTTAGNPADGNAFGLAYLVEPPTNFSSLVINVSGKMAIDLTETPAIRPQTGVSAPQIGDCLVAAHAIACGGLTQAGTTLTLYAADGSTQIVATLDSATDPQVRTPVE